MLRRQQLYEDLHPETRQHFAGAVAANAAMGRGDTNDNLSLASFAADTAAKTGINKRSIQRSIRRAKRIAPEVQDKILNEMPEIADNKAELDALASVTPDQQIAAIDAVQAGKTRNLRETLSPEPAIAARLPAAKSVAQPVVPETADLALLTDVEAEQRLLGVLITNNQAFFQVSDTVRSFDFSTAAHVQIFGAIPSLMGDSKDANQVTLSNFLDHDGQFVGVDERQYLAQLANAASTVIDLEGHARRIVDLSCRRAAINICREAIIDLLKVDSDRQTVDILSDLNRALLDVTKPTGIGRRRWSLEYQLSQDPAVADKNTAESKVVTLTNPRRRYRRHAANAGEVSADPAPDHDTGEPKAEQGTQYKNGEGEQTADAEMDNAAITVKGLADSKEPQIDTAKSKCPKASGTPNHPELKPDCTAPVKTRNKVEAQTIDPPVQVRRDLRKYKRSDCCFPGGQCNYTKCLEEDRCLAVPRSDLQNASLNSKPLDGDVSARPTMAALRS